MTSGLNILNPSADEPFLHPGRWWHAEGDQIVCDLCPRECRLREGDRGFCFVRQNVANEMVLTTYGRSTGFCIDPIEKKPLNHFYPGTSVLSFGTAGCNLGCKFCQNWDISKSRQVERLSSVATPDAIARAASELGCHSVAYTYNDPIIWAEYAIDTANACRAVGIKSVAVTAGYITPQARGEFYHAMDAANVDLKAFTEDFYYKLTLSHLDPVLDTLKWLHEETDVWFEITNLIIPDANDSPDELKRLADWVLKSVGDEVPVHFSAFHPDYRMTDRPRTPPETLQLAREIAKRVGIKHVYTGNVDDVTRQSTYCPNCDQVVIERNWYELGVYALNGNQCGHCGTTIPGRFANAAGTWGRKRQRVDMRQFAREEDAAIASSLQTNETIRIYGNPTAPQQDPSEMEPNLNFTTDQQTAVLDAATEYLVAAIENRQPTLADGTIGGLAQNAVHGTFVSVKRNKQLRSCCGTVGKARPLADSLARSAERTAKDDPRFPPISPTEVGQLDMEVWLLGPAETVAEQGTDRIEAIEVGKHGLVIQRGQKRGLLLPGVPVEYGWNSEEFLNRTCVKAGLPPSAWREDDTVLQRFPGVAFSKSLESLPEVATSKRIFSPREFAQYAQHSRRTIEMMLAGGVTSYYVPEVPDKNVQGVVLILRRSDEEKEQVVASKLHWKNTVPMQATMHSLCQDIAGIASRMKLTANEFQTWLMVADDSAMHGNAIAPDLEDFDPKHRAIMVVHGARSALLFDPELDAQTLMTNAVAEAGITERQKAMVFSFLVHTNHERVRIVNRPVPSGGRDTRPPAVAGRFYPAEPDQMNSMLDEMLTGDAHVGSYPAAMIPHAGWKYSGRLAANVLKRIELPKTIIIIGPKHTSAGLEWAVAPHETWTLPGGEVASDRQLATRLVESIPGLSLDAAAHQVEHSIEVELPIIKRLSPNSKVVGIAVAGGSAERLNQFAEGLADVIAEMDEPPLLLISSDMNHFANEAETHRLDKLAIEKLLAREPDSLFQTCRSNHISMCGVVPAVIVMKTLQRLNKLNNVELVGHMTSADVTGDPSRVVGYAGMLFS